MTVKEQLHRVIDGMSDLEAAGLLRLIATPGAGDDAMAAYLATAPPDDEPLTAEDLDAAREALGDLAADRLVGLDELDFRSDFPVRPDAAVEPDPAAPPPSRPRSSVRLRR